MELHTGGRAILYPQLWRRGRKNFIWFPRFDSTLTYYPFILLLATWDAGKEIKKHNYGNFLFLPTGSSWNPQFPTWRLNAFPSALIGSNQTRVFWSGNDTLHIRDGDFWVKNASREWDVADSWWWKKGLKQWKFKLNPSEWEQWGWADTWGLSTKDSSNAILTA